MTGPLPQGELGIERMCQLAGVSRAGFYRHWQASAPRQEETGLRDAIQKLALRHRHYGYRRIAASLSRAGLLANHKRVLRLMREDNLLCLRRAAFVPTTTDSRHSWRVVRNLARGMELTGLDQLWVADITYVHLAEAFGYLAIVLDAFNEPQTVVSISDFVESVVVGCDSNCLDDRRTSARCGRPRHIEFLGMTNGMRQALRFFRFCFGAEFIGTKA